MLSRRRPSVLVAAALLTLGAGASGPSRALAAPGPLALGPLRVSIDKSKVDLTAHRLEVKASNAIVRATVHVVGTSGAVLADVDQPLSDNVAGAPLVLSWTPSSDETAQTIEVYVYDAGGHFYHEVITATSWSVSIPHEEVSFATDSAAIADSERSKLEASFAQVSEAIAKHPEVRGVTLFIAGHTDTVGSNEYNLRLSRARAQAIARWFRQRGLRIGIGWEGFGESALLVKTADNIDEPRNRRVDYILSVDEPTLKASGFRPTWNRL